MPHFGPASKALADFSLAHRDRYWHLLSWRHRSRAPTTVAHKLSYFSELLVVECVSHFLEGCPEFWHSDRLRRACSSSLWIQTDVDFFTQVCCAQNAAVGSFSDLQCKLCVRCRSLHDVVCNCSSCLLLGHACGALFHTWEPCRNSGEQWRSTRNSRNTRQQLTSCLPCCMVPRQPAPFRSVSATSLRVINARSSQTALHHLPNAS